MEVNQRLEHLRRRAELEQRLLSTQPGGLPQIPDPDSESDSVPEGEPSPSGPVGRTGELPPPESPALGFPVPEFPAPQSPAPQSPAAGVPAQERGPVPPGAPEPDIIELEPVSARDGETGASLADGAPAWFTRAMGEAATAGSGYRLPADPGPPVEEGSVLTDFGAALSDSPVRSAPAPAPAPTLAPAGEVRPDDGAVDEAWVDDGPADDDEAWVDEGPADDDEAGADDGPADETRAVGASTPAPEPLAPMIYDVLAALRPVLQRYSGITVGVWPPGRSADDPATAVRFTMDPENGLSLQMPGSSSTSPAGADDHSGHRSVAVELASLLRHDGFTGR